MSDRPSRGRIANDRGGAIEHVRVDEIDAAVAVDVSRIEPGGIVARSEAQRGRETAVAGARQHRDRVGRRFGEYDVGRTIAVDVDDLHGARLNRFAGDRRGAEASVAQIARDEHLRQHGRDDQVGRSIVVDVHRGYLVRRGDRNRSRVHEAASLTTGKDRDDIVATTRDCDIRDAVGIEVGDRQPGRVAAYRKGDGRRERAVAATVQEGDGVVLDAARVDVGDHEVDDAVRIDVERDDLSGRIHARLSWRQRERAVGLAEVDGNGGVEDSAEREVRDAVAI